jgi:hypothetical protein
MGDTNSTTTTNNVGSAVNILSAPHRIKGELYSIIIPGVHSRVQRIKQQQQSQQYSILLTL